MSSERIVCDYTAKQAHFLEAIFSRRYRYLAFGGAIRGGKSFAAIGAAIALCRVFPGSRWAISRKDLPTLRRNTVPTIEKLRPEGFIASLNQSTWSYRCTNGSELLLFPESIKDDPDLDRWKGLEVNGFVLEEGNELSEKSWFKAIERAGSWIIPGVPADRQPDPLILVTFNPAANWVKRTFYDPFILGTLEPPFFYLPATIDDNPHVGDAFRESIKNLPPAEYKRFVKGEWDAIQDPDQLISFEWVARAREREPILGKLALGVDVARYGDDQTVLCTVEGRTVRSFDPHRGLPVDRVWVHVQKAIADGPIDADRVKVDTVGLGAGVADIGKSKGYRVVEVVSGAAVPQVQGSFFKFKNLRSFMWWKVRELLRTNELCLAACPTKLIEDLTAPRYEITGDKMIQVESKDDIKKRLGRSTDYGDALVYALYEPLRTQWWLGPLEEAKR